MGFADAAILEKASPKELVSPNLSSIFPSLTRKLNSRTRIAVDPGKAGAIALLEGPDLVDVKDMPIRIEYGDLKLYYRNGVPYEKREEFRFVDAKGVYEIFWDWSKNYFIDEAIFEDVTVTFDENMSKHSASKLGHGAGIVEGAAGAVGLSFEDKNLYTVQPSVWKRKLGVTKDKKTSLEYARELWPNFTQSHFKLQKHNDRAEAALIGYYRHLTQGVVK